MERLKTILKVRSGTPPHADRLIGNQRTSSDATSSAQRSLSDLDSPNLTTSDLSPPFPDGIKVWYDCPDATIDVCFVHGLTGNRDSTWTVSKQSTPWPAMLLPPKLPRARLLAWGYDAYVVQASVVSENRLTDHATNLLIDITNDRASCGATSRPLIFVAHSLGGLVCKEAILLSRNNPESHLCSIFEYTTGIIFMGTPHRGSWIADWMKIPASSLGVLKSTNKSLLQVLRTDNQLLESIQVRFWSMVRGQRESGRRLEITCFFEELPLPVFGKVVSKQSATIEGYTSVSVHANHRDMVKFRTKDDNGFKRLVGDLMRWAPSLSIGQIILASREAPVVGIDVAYNCIPVPSNQLAMTQHPLKEDSTSIRSAIEDMVRTSIESIYSEISILKNDTAISQEAIISLINDSSGLNQLRQARSNHLVEASEQLFSRRQQFLAIRKKPTAGGAEPTLMTNNVGDYNHRRPSSENLTLLLQMQGQLKDLAQQVSLLAESTSAIRDCSFSRTPDKVRETSDLISYLARGICQLLAHFWVQYRHVRQFFSVAWSILQSCTFLLGNNIQFEDVLGRTRSLPYEQFRHWEVFSAMLRCEFKGLPGESQVLTGHYQIMSTGQTRRLVSPELWESFIAPGSKIVMAVVLEHLSVLSGICPKCGGVLQSLYGNYDRDQSLHDKQCQACSFVVSESAAISYGSEPSLLPEINIVNTMNNMEGKGKVDIMASPSAVTTSQNASEPITSIDSAGPDATLKAFRRIHFFTPNRNSEIRTLKKVIARACSTTRSAPLGEIYLFYDSRFPNIIRIGFTSRTPDMRLREWKSRCSSTLVLIPDTLSRPVYYPRRLEQLIHIDLESRRRRDWCQYCNHYHNEGFEVSKQLALATVQLWRRWMESEPYNEAGKLKLHWEQQIRGSSSPITRKELYMMLEHR